MSTIGERIKKLRKVQRMTQTDLAGDHMTKSMLSQIENGHAMPSMKSLQYIAMRLGQDASYFLEVDNDSNISELVRELEVDFKQKAYEEIVRKSEPFVESKLPSTVDAARLLEFYANACFETGRSIGEEALSKAVEIYNRFGLVIESAKAKYLKYAFLFSQNKFGSCLDLIREVRQEYEQKKIGRDILFEIDLYYAETVVLSALGLFQESRDGMLKALALSREEKVYYHTGHFYRMLAGNALLLGDNDLEAKYREKAWEVARFTEDPEAIALLEIREAKVNNGTGDYKEALEHAEKYAELLQKRDGLYWICVGIAYYGMNRYDEALDALLQVTIPDLMYHPLDRAFINGADAYIAQIYGRKGLLKEAKEHATKAYENVKSMIPSQYRTIIVDTFREWGEPVE